MRMKDVLGTDREPRELKGLLEDVVRCMLKAKFEVYEALRKDSYPRFLLSSDCATLNGNENFKRLLAAEKWDDEVQRTTTPPSPRHSMDDHKKSLSYEVTLTAPGSILWGKQPRHETLEPPSSSRERHSDGGGRQSFNSEGRSHTELEIRTHTPETEIRSHTPETEIQSHTPETEHTETEIRSNTPEMEMSSPPEIEIVVALQPTPM